MQKLSILMIFTILFGTFTACTPAKAGPGQTPTEATKQIRVGVIFSTTIKDEGYAQAAYNALMEMKEKYNLDVSFQENVTDAAIKDVLRSYASDGYDLIIAHQLYFTDPVNEVAAEFPDTMFAISGGFRADHPNVVAVDATNWEASYLAGTLAGLMTKTNKLAIITASESPIAKRMVNSFRSAAQAQNPNVTVKHVFTGSFEDVVKGKEMATAVIRDGADIIFTNCGVGNFGAIEAAQENGVYAIGSSVDLAGKAPDTVLTSAVLSPGEYIKIIINGYMNKDLEWGKYYPMGVKAGIESLAPFHNFEDKIPQEVKDKLEKVRQDIIDGKITAPPNE